MEHEAISFSKSYPDLYYLMYSILRNISNDISEQNIRVIDYYTKKFNKQIRHMTLLSLSKLISLNADANIINSMENGLEKLDRYNVECKFTKPDKLTKDQKEILAFKTALENYTTIIRGIIY